MRKYIRITLPEEFEWLGVINMRARSKIILELLKEKTKEELLKLALQRNSSDSDGSEEVFNKDILKGWD